MKVRVRVGMYLREHAPPKGVDESNKQWAASSLARYLGFDYSR